MHYENKGNGYPSRNDHLTHLVYTSKDRSITTSDRGCARNRSSAGLSSDRLHSQRGNQRFPGTEGGKKGDPGDRYNETQRRIRTPETDL